VMERPNVIVLPASIMDFVPKLGKAELRVFLAVAAAQCGWQRQPVDLSLTDLMERTGLSRVSVVRAARSLQEAGILRRRCAMTETGGHKTATYSIAWDDEEPAEGGTETVPEDESNYTSSGSTDKPPWFNGDTSVGLKTKQQQPDVWLNKHTTPAADPAPTSMKAHTYITGGIHSTSSSKCFNTSECYTSSHSTSFSECKSSSKCRTSTSIHSTTTGYSPLRLSYKSLRGPANEKLNPPRGQPRLPEMGHAEVLTSSPPAQPRPRKRSPYSYRQSDIDAALREAWAYFPEDWFPDLNVYLDNCGAENKSGTITLGREVSELQALAAVCDEIGPEAFIEGLRIANRAGVPNPNYVKKAGRSHARKQRYGFAAAQADSR